VAEGYQVNIIDENAQLKPFDNNELSQLLQDALCVGVSSMTGHQIANGLEFSKIVREINPNIPIVWGGAHPTLFPKECLESPLIDFVIRGQGESTFRKLINAISSSSRLKPYLIPGVCEKMENQFFITETPSLEDKNLFPSFPWDTVDVEFYIRNDSGISNRVINYVSSQGCPYGCGFCSEVALHKRKWTAFSAERVLADAKLLVNRFNVNGIKFYDANFFVDLKRVITIAQGLKTYGLSWAASSHPNSLLQLRTPDWNLLSASGCKRLLIGLESGSESILKLIKKQYSVQNTLILAKKLSDANITGSFTFVVGFPNSPDPDEVSKTIELGKIIRHENPNHEVKIHFYAPYPGTPLWETALSAGFVAPKTLDNWSKYDYYQIQTPWLQHGLEPLVEKFNKENCPYVQL